MAVFFERLRSITVALASAAPVESVMLPWTAPKNYARTLIGPSASRRRTKLTIFLEARFTFAPTNLATTRHSTNTTTHLTVPIHVGGYKMLVHHFDVVH